MQAANALTSLSRRIAGFAGPALAALLVATVSVRGALLVDVATFAAGIGSLLLVREPAAGPRRERTSFATDVRDGFRAVAARRWLAIEIGVGAVQITAALAPWLVLLPVVAKHDLGGAGAYGSLLIAMSGGAILGALAGGRIRAASPGVVASLALVPFSAALAGLALHWPLPVLIVLHVAAGLGSEIYGVLWVTAIQQSVPAVLRGRVFAIDQLGSLALLPVGMMLAGSLAGAGNAALVLIAAGVINLVTSVVPLVFADVRAFRDTRAAGEVTEPADPRVASESAAV